ncbi:hypothetical protein NRB56_35790 [Nocardia sp. RB56]|uniref:Schlafen AlbA-2 domain-containing protein n=2 Tax=Nocardia aurantia TaxID=2585199 RepID=A0A7K0DQD8_9NOCA|nr:hypothetical protein [Nocardia aurantia]
MNVAELADVVDCLRAIGRDDLRIEAKRAGGGLPQGLRETLSAFSNTDGGVIVLGLDEHSGFVATGVGDPGKISADLVDLARKMEPPLRPIVEVLLFESVMLVVAEVPELPRDQKPCFNPGAGIVNGSYIRVGDSDRKMTSYEVQLMLANRGQPRHDEEPVPGTGVDDLDPIALRGYIDRLRSTRPHAYADLDDGGVLRSAKVLVPHETGSVLSVGGLLSLGRLPQHYFPQLMVSFVHYPTVDGAEIGSGVRYLDSIVAEGPVPVMLQEVLRALRRNMTRRAVVNGLGREDIWEYPEIVLREAVVNAVVHRDLSPDSRGTQVQVEMYPDRLVVRNPGGLFGTVTVDDLGEDGISSSRNAMLLRILRDVVLPDDGRPVCENVGSGIRTMVAALRAAGMRPPEFRDKISHFSVTFGNHALLGDDVVAWIRGLRQAGLTDGQCVGLALLRDGDLLDNQTYRRATGVDSRVATAELQNLVARGLAEQIGTKRWTSYRLTVTAAQPPSSAQPADRRAQILAVLESEELGRGEIAIRADLTDVTARRWLRTMVSEGLLEQVGNSRSRNLKYRRADTLFQPSPDPNTTDNTANTDEPGP